MIDSDLAHFYKVGTRDLNKAVSRNKERFPEDFLFQIIRSFIKLRELLHTNEVLTERLKNIEARTDEHAKVIIQIIQELQNPLT